MFKHDNTGETPELIALINQYWAIDDEGKFKFSTSQILPAGDIKTSYQLNQLIKSHGKGYCADVICPSCQSELQVTSRSQYTGRRPSYENHCSACRATIYETLRQQKEHEQKRLSEERALRLAPILAMLERQQAEGYDYRFNDPSMNFTMHIILNIVGASDVFTVNDIAGSLDEDQSIPANLLHAGMLTPKCKASTVGIEPTADGYSVDFDRTIFMFCQPKDGRDIDAVMAQYLAQDIPFTRELQRRWIDYAKDQVSTYLLQQCDFYDQRISPEAIAKTIAVIEPELNHYSISQIWYCVWMAVKASASLSTTQYFNKTKAPESIPGKLVKLFANAKKGFSVMREWNRPPSISENMIGIMFRHVFDINDTTTGRVIDLMAAEHDPVEPQGLMADKVDIVFSELSDVGASATFLSTLYSLFESGLDLNDAYTEAVAQFDLVQNQE